MAKDDKPKSPHETGINGGISFVADKAALAVRGADAVAVDPMSDLVAGLVNGGIKIAEGTAKGGVALVQGDLTGAVKYTAGGVAGGVATGLVDGVPYVGEVGSAITLPTTGKTAGAFAADAARDGVEGLFGSGVEDKGATQGVTGTPPGVKPQGNGKDAPSR